MSRSAPQGPSRRAVLAALAGGATLLAAPARAGGNPASQVGLESALTCQCGCGLTVHSCNHLNCGSGIPLKQEIAEQIAAGGTEEQILSYFQKKYGEKILSAPTTTGFNLAAWTMPFVGIGIGAAIIGWVLARWRRGAALRPSPVETLGTTGLDPARRERLDAALRDWDERS